MRIKTVHRKDLIIPQANSIYKIIEMCAYLFENDCITDENLFMSILNVNTPRQVKYYKDAAYYLGLLDESGNFLSEVGKMIFSQSNDIMLKLIVYKILESDIFANYYTNRSFEEVNHIIKNIYKLADSTVERRMSTIEQWIVWCDFVLTDYPENEIIFIND